MTTKEQSELDYKLSHWCDDGGFCPDGETPLPQNESSTPIGDMPGPSGFNAPQGTGSDSTVSDIIAWENGEMDPRREVSFFQRLVDSGLAWQLQGVYGRQAQRLIDAGLVHLAGRAGVATLRTLVFFGCLGAWALVLLWGIQQFSLSLLGGDL